MPFKPCPPEFFVVVVEGRRGPKKRHDTQASAEAEGQRLRDLGDRRPIHVAAPVAKDTSARRAVHVLAPVSVLPSNTLSLKKKATT